MSILDSNWLSAALACILALTSCALPLRDPKVQVAHAFDHGVLSFTLRYANGNLPVSVDRVEVREGSDDSGKLTWAFYCADYWKLTTISYGDAPQKCTTVAQHQPLRPGKPYVFIVYHIVSEFSPTWYAFQAPD